MSTALALPGILAAIPPSQSAGEIAPKHMTLAEAKKADVILKLVFPAYPRGPGLYRDEGAGTATMEIDPATGRVTDAHISVSTDSEALNQAALHAFRKWRFKPGTISEITVPISFGLGEDRPAKRDRSMTDILESYVGKGSVLSASLPQYPEPWKKTAGKGLYEIHVNRFGGGCTMKVLLAGGDPAFDRAVRLAVGRWKFSRGPLVIELPLAFSLTPDSYRLDVAR